MSNRRRQYKSMTVKVTTKIHVEKSLLIMQTILLKILSHLLRPRVRKLVVMRVTTLTHQRLKVILIHLVGLMQMIQRDTSQVGRTTTYHPFGRILPRS